MSVYILKTVDANLFKCTNFIDRSEVQAETDRWETTFYNTFFLLIIVMALINKVSWIGSYSSMDYVLMNKVFDE